MTPTARRSPRSILSSKTRNGEIKGVAIEYGGFLGFGEKGAILTLDQVKPKDGKPRYRPHRGAAPDAPGLEPVTPTSLQTLQRAVLRHRAFACPRQDFLSHSAQLAQH